MWTLQIYDQGELLNSDVVEEDAVQVMTEQFESQGFEVRAEPAWQPSPNSVTVPQGQVSESEHELIHRALAVIHRQLQVRQVFARPDDVKQFCQLHTALEKEEYFCCLFLDSQHRLIAFERLFRGTIDGASVYPRVVVKRALELNAAALILTHNHPSGLPNPSSADSKITQRLKDALALVDIRVLDHIVVGVEGTQSMAERGLL
jgi:DNA repair protein RadC